MRFHYLLAIFVLAALASAQASSQDVPVRPTATYLQAFRDSTAPQRVFSGKEDSLDPNSGIVGFTAVDLDALGHRPGDILSLSTFGGTRFAASDPDPRGSLRGAIAVFSLDDVVLGRRNLNRVPGAIDVLGLAEALTAPTGNGGRPTDIPEDFVIRETPLSVVIPEGARFLHFAVSDSSYDDNLAGSLQTHVSILGTNRSVPEPTSGLLSGLFALGLAVTRRRRGFAINFVQA